MTRQLMKADFAAYPNELVSAPCSTCHKQVDIGPYQIGSEAEFYQREEELRGEATTKCRGHQ